MTAEATTRSASVAVIITTLEVGGAEKQSIILTRALQQFRPAFLVVRHGDRITDALRSFASASGVRVVPLHGSRLRKFFTAVRLFRSQRTTTAIAFLPGDNLWLALVKPLAGIRHALGSIRVTPAPPLKLFVLRLLHRWVFKGTIFNSMTALDYFTARGFARSTCVYLPNSVRIPDHVDAARPLDRFDIVTVARFVPQKDVATALAGFRLFLDGGVGAAQPHLFLAGYGILEAEICAQVADLNLTEHVTFLPADVAKDELYRRCHLCLSTSVSEGMSNTILEAMSYALPGVVTDVGDSARLIRQGENGVVIPPRDASAVAAALRHMYELGAERQAMGSRSRELTEEYSYERFVRSCGGLLDSLDRTGTIGSGS